MQDIYEEMIAACQTIAAAFPPPRFYACCESWISLSRAFFFEDGQVRRCRELILHELQDNFGHGMEHAEKVAMEAGALAGIEGERLALRDGAIREARLLAQMAGLLHDIRRGEKDHAQTSASAAGKILKGFPSLSPEQGRYIMEAIANHEAFVEPKEAGSPVGKIVSDVLYDADKFRWGPDNFTFTLWQMLRFAKAPIVRLIRRFPKGMKDIARIKDTFRSDTGKTYGPEFIDLGLQMGEKIYQFLLERFAADLRAEEKDEEMGR
ncbi:MAG: hypothetical protein QME78_06820 [Thermodesulfobacteriota bacterium]|nr:hypothetical protein [Thermodesulfobacteriota bacterium]